MFICIRRLTFPNIECFISLCSIQVIWLCKHQLDFVFKKWKENKTTFKETFFPLPMDFNVGAENNKTTCIHMFPFLPQDWIWSVGCNPLSITSQGWHISKFQSDTIARSYILTTLEESIQIVNSAIQLLVVERTCILSSW